ncbi:MAG TPA: glutamyl-tRNA reductase [Salinisphaeraceae bacterium]|nr:glutamyl-tRNA reductase [Salinisphaeraceae bacterium]
MLLTVGLNHNTAPLAVRETMAFPPEQFDAALSGLLRLPEIAEGALLSTCNRTEVYAVAQAAASARKVQHWLCEQRGLDSSGLAKHFYIYQGRDSIRHTLRVAAGLDSMILGEPQILGQMKDAYRQARSVHGAGPLLTRLFEHSFTVAKQIRTETDISSHPVSVAYAGVNLAQSIFADLTATRVILIGAGETIDLCARHLASFGVRRMVFANRSVERAQALASRHHGYAVELHDVGAHLADADMIISSTAAPHAIIGHDQLKAALRQRRRKPIFALDLAVPRDIEPAAAKLEDIYLYTVDDLEGVIQENQESRKAAAQQADAMLDARIDEFLDWLESRRANHTIAAMRAQAQNMQAQALARARRDLARGRPMDEVLQHFGHALTNKLMHAPSVALRNSRGTQQHVLLESARELYQLDDDEPTHPGQE